MIIIRWGFFNSLILLHTRLSLVITLLEITSFLTQI